MRFENLFRVSLIIIFLVAAASISHSKEHCEAVFGNGPHTFFLATGSPGELGLLRVLGEAFSGETDTTLCWVKAGSGEALRLLKAKKVDMVLVHSTDAEKKAVAEGWATKRTLIGSNEFYIVGPSDDPAKISEAKSAAEAYARIAERKEKFFSRGDNSGTHKKEMEIWKRSGISPSGDWYIITKGFMVASLKRADLEKGYFMTDNSTWVVEKSHLPQLRVLFRGDKVMVNTYHALCQHKGATPNVSIATRFIEFLASEKGQKIMRDFGKEQYGEALYNDAEYARQYDD